MIRCVVFDFDGTLVDSNQVKHDSFFAVVDAISGGREIMERVLAAPDRGDRHAVFDKFSMIARLPSGSNRTLAQKYSDLCAAQIRKCPNMPGVTPAMELLYARRQHLYVNSATPEAALLPIVQARDFSRLLAGIFGGPATKVDNLRRILTELDLPPMQTVVVGDGSDDYVAATQIGCPFLPVFSFARANSCGSAPLRTLSELPAAIDMISKQAAEAHFDGRE